MTGWGFARALVALLVMMPGLAWAHPHAWIDVAVDVRFDAAGRIVALVESWLFDEFYTASAVGKGDPMRVEQMLIRTMANLKPHGFFTQVQSGTRTIAVQPPVARSARVENGRLTMRFDLPLAEPVQPAVSQPFRYQIYDPTYYIEILHKEGADAIRLVGAPVGCKAQRQAPQPDPKAVAAAARLDRDQTGATGLGRFFAETVEIRCEAKR